MIAINEPPQSLTPRETEVGRLICEGLISKEISTRLGISMATVKRHRESIHVKLNAHNAADVVRKMMQMGLIA